jgi:hypothetical protein
MDDVWNSMKTAINRRSFVKNGLTAAGVGFLASGSSVLAEDEHAGPITRGDEPCFGSRQQRRYRKLTSLAAVQRTRGRSGQRSPGWKWKPSLHRCSCGSGFRHSRRRSSVFQSAGIPPNHRRGVFFQCGADESTRQSAHGSSAAISLREFRTVTGGVFHAKGGSSWGCSRLRADEDRETQLRGQG